QQPILIVEDDAMIRDLIKVYLEYEGYEVIEAEDGEVAKAQYDKYDPSLLILDLMLPKVTGEEVCDWVREDRNDEDVVIIMLTAKSRSSDKISGLKMGADYYIRKPFEPDELIAQVKAALRRRKTTAGQKITSQGLMIQPRERTVHINGTEVEVTKHEFDLLYYLMAHPNVVFTREQLVQELYPHNQQQILDRTIDAHIKKIREKVEATPSKSKRIMKINKKRKWLPSRFLWRITLVNFLVITIAIIVSGWAIYHTACFLVDGMGNFTGAGQEQFNATLFQYLILFGGIGLFIGILVQFYFTKKLLKPIEALVQSTKMLQQGIYPSPIPTEGDDEIAELTKQYNELLAQLQRNE